MIRSRILLPLLLLACSGVVSALPILPEQETAAPTAQTPLTRGFQAMAARQPEEAMLQFREAIRLDPKSVLPWLGLADAARLANKGPVVEEALSKAMALAPDRAEPVIALARWRIVNSAYDEAERLLRQAVKMDPKLATPLVDLGDFYASVRHDSQQAIGFYRDAVRVDPKSARAQTALGAMLLRQRDAIGALAHLEAARDLADAKDAKPSLLLGKVYSVLRRWKDAQSAFSRAIAVQPRFADAYVGRSVAFAAAGNRGKALEDLRQAETIDPKNAEIPLRIGILQQEEGKAKEAYEAYGRAIEVDPRLTIAYNNLAWLAASRRERLEEALAWIKRARELAPKDSMFLDTHGWVLRARGDLEGAASVLQEGVALKPSADLHYHLGVVQMERRHSEDARDNLRRALQLQPDFGEARDAKLRLQQLEAVGK